MQARVRHCGGHQYLSVRFYKRVSCQTQSYWGGGPYIMMRDPEIASSSVGARVVIVEILSKDNVTCGLHKLDMAGKLELLDPEGEGQATNAASRLS
eukprot:937070-Amphidinium_carterae.1